MKIVTEILLIVVIFAAVIYGNQLLVSKRGNDSNPGMLAAPLRTIQRAADLAQPGDIIIVHKNIYHERNDSKFINCFGSILIRKCFEERNIHFIRRKNLKN